jgi:hypothetical protein
MITSSVSGEGKLLFFKYCDCFFALSGKDGNVLDLRKPKLSRINLTNEVGIVNLIGQKT